MCLLPVWSEETRKRVLARDAQKISYKNLVSIVATAAMLICALMWLVIPSAWAAEDAQTSGATQTLSGTIGETTISSEVSTVILDGVTVTDDATITMEGSQVTLTVKDGTSNSTGLIQTNGSLEITGAGDLTATSLFAGESMTWNYTGTLTITDGVVMTSTGDLIFNSGTYNVRGEDDQHYAFASLAGDVYLNGGTFTLYGYTHAIHSATGAIVLAGGTLDASATEVAIMAGNRMSNGVIIGPSMQLAGGLTTKDISTEDDSIVCCVVNSDGNLVTSVTGEGPAVAQGSVTTEGATYLTADEAKAASSSGGISSGRLILIGLICAAVLVAAVAGCLAVRASNKKKKVRG